jgi:tetratricopeptide (TPR) repeat protein
MKNTKDEIESRKRCRPLAWAKETVGGLLLTTECITPDPIVKKIACVECRYFERADFKARGGLCRVSTRAIITSRPFVPPSSLLRRSKGSSMTSPRRGALDVLFAGIVCGLAFLLASTPARNSDLWMHLASGRLLALGQFSPGIDPFASTTKGVYWINHAWFSDYLLYEIYKLGDGRALVLAKAVLVVLLTGLFFCFRRRGASMGVVALAAAGAVLALGPWLQLQPLLLSLLGVVLTLYLLENTGASRWLLIPLFALWANLDGWFVLGPILIAFYAFGEALSRVFGGAQRARFGELRALTMLLAAGLAACCLTPYHYHTFAWPTPLGLSHTEQVLMRDPLGQTLVVSPFGANFASAPAFASPGGWAYCALLAAVAASFVLCGRNLRPGRLLISLALAALSFYQARAIPFFAVAAAPVIILNIQDWALTAATGKPRPRLWAVAQTCGAAAGLALLVVACPGWLQPAPFQPRGWTVEPDESLVRLARQLDQWHSRQRFQPDRFAFTFSPEVASYLAWFCPAEKGFLDSRWPLFDGAADDFIQMRNRLLKSDDSIPDPKLASLLDAHQIDRIILHDQDWGRTTQAFRRLLLDEQEWALLDVQGTAALFGRRSGARSPSPWTPYDRRQAAYAPEPDRRAPLVAAPMPPPGFFDSFYRVHDERSAERGEAALHLLYFDWTAEQGQMDLGRQWLLAEATGLIGTGQGSDAAGTASALGARLFLTPPPSADSPSAVGPFAGGFLASHEHGPLDALLLAVRAARRALAVDPNDAGAFLLLGEAYVRLMTQTREPSWQAKLPALAAFRRAQALTALEQAASLRPDLDQAHALLAQLYFETGQLDRTLDHLRARLRIAEQQASAAGKDRQAALRADVKSMEALVQRSQTVYEGNIAGKTDPSKVMERASLAARHGLSGKALEMLLQSHPAIFGKAGAQMQLELMQEAGRSYDVRSWLDPRYEALLGYSPYHLLEAEAAAACGDYAAADAELDVLGQPLSQVGVSADQLAPVRSAVALRVGMAVLDRPAFGTGVGDLAGAAFFQFDSLKPLGTPAELLRQEADLQVLRGLLALESGEVEAARHHFRAALDVWGGDGPAAASAGLDFPARPIAQYGMGLFENIKP